MPTAYLFFLRSEPRFVTEGDELGTFEKLSGGVATYRTPLAENVQNQIRNTLDQLERLTRQEPARAEKPELKQSIERMQDLLEKGTATGVDVAHGMIIRLGAADWRTEFQDFRWLDRIPPKSFDIGATKWEDFTSDPTAAGTDDLLMIAHNAGWSPGMKSGDTRWPTPRLADRSLSPHPVPGCFVLTRLLPQRSVEGGRLGHGPAVNRHGTLRSGPEDRRE